MNLRKLIFDDTLPIYWPKKNFEAEDKVFLAIWNCGTRPQTLWQAIKDTQITIRKGIKILFVIKKGSV
jgi:hypothetical protein